MSFCDLNSVKPTIFKSSVSYIYNEENALIKIHVGTTQSVKHLKIANIFLLQKYTKLSES